MAETSQNNTKYKIAIGILLLLLLIGGFYFQNKVSSLTIAPPNKEQKDLLSQWGQKADELIVTLEEEKARIEAEMKLIPEKSDNWELKNYMLRAVNEKISALEEIKLDISFYRDTLDLRRIDKRMKLAVQEARSSVGANKLTSDIVDKINQMDNIKFKIDSLDAYIVQAKKDNAQKGTALSIALKQRNAYKDTLTVLQHTSVRLERERDSLQQLVILADSTIDSLNTNFASANEAYEKRKKETMRKAELATYMQTWYYEKEKMKRPQRRALADDKQDYNRGNDIKTIHGFFNIGADKFVPFKVANIVLFKIDGNSKEQVAESKMTVRNQSSGEFSLITEPGLDQGDYLVQVEYNGNIILENKFYVAK